MTENVELAIVVVDDNEMDRYLVRRYLEKRVGFDGFLEAATGLEFLEEICDQRKLDEFSSTPVVVLLDINMPRLNGFDTALALQERVEAGRVPNSLVVMMFTSSHSPEDRKRAEEIDIIKGYIIKPMDDDDVKTLVDLYTRLR